MSSLAKPLLGRSEPVIEGVEEEENARAHEHVKFQQVASGDALVCPDTMMVSPVEAEVASAAVDHRGACQTVALCADSV